jgi:hypothetical protein
MIPAVVDHDLDTRIVEEPVGELGEMAAGRPDDVRDQLGDDHSLDGRLHGGACGDACPHADEEDRPGVRMRHQRQERLVPFLLERPRA